MNSLRKNSLHPEPKPKWTSFLGMPQWYQSDFFLPHSFIQDIALQGTKFYARASASLIRAWPKVQQLLKSKALYDPAIPLLGIYSDKTIIRKDTCTPMFIAALFTIAKTWKQPKCPSTDEWKEDVVHVYNGILLSRKKRMK